MRTVSAHVAAALALCWCRAACGSIEPRSEEQQDERYPKRFRPLSGHQASPLADDVSLLQTAHLEANVSRQKNRKLASRTETSNQFLFASVSNRLKQFLAIEKAKRMPAVPWFYSPRMDGSKLGSLSYSHTLSNMEETFRAIEQEKLSALEQNPSNFVFPMRVSVRDEGDFGRILHKVPCKDGNTSCFHLRTIFGMYMALSPDGSITGNRSTPWGLGSKWAIAPHPFVEGRQCLQTFHGQCCGLGPPVSKAENSYMLQAVIPAEGVNSTTANITESSDDEGPFIVVSFENNYVLTAEFSPVLSAQWRAAREEGTPYEMTEFLADLVPGHERFPRRNGFVVGLVVGGFFVLFAYNLRFALTTPAAAARARLPEFDVMRFVLELLVIHAHLRLLGLNPGNQDMYMTSWRMPSFMVIAGIFGANVAYESLSKLLCCTLGTVVLMVIVRLLEYWALWGPDKVAESVGKQFRLDLIAPGLWFLTCLAGNRLVLSPMFHAARKFNVRALAPCLFVKVATYFLMHWTKDWKGWVASQYVWDNFLAFAPYFAVGLLMSAKEWHAVLQKRWVQALCCSYFLLWYLMMMVPPFFQWNSSYCLPTRQAHGCTAHYDPEQFTGPINIQTFLLDHVMFALRLGVAVSFMGVAVPLVEVVGRIWPQIIELMAGWGSRTLYTYVIHLHCVTLMTEDGFLAFGKAFPDSASWVLSVVLPFFINIVLSSEGSEHWFRWLLMPFWIKDFLEGKYFGCRNIASRLPFLTVKKGAEPDGQR